MRVAFLIPHCFLGNNADSLHGSSWTTARDDRARIVDRAIAQLHALWGNRHSGLDAVSLQAIKGDNPHRIDFDVFVFTTRGLHLLDQLKTQPLFTHVQSDAEPPFLGFECAKWMRDHLGSYDYYVYLEDDLLIHDPLFMTKIDLFNKQVSARMPLALLQPQRYELAVLAADERYIGNLDRLYIDYSDAAVPRRTAPPVKMTFLGMKIELEAAPNPHAGCYILSDAQAGIVARHPDFLKHSAMYDEPGDMAATAFIHQALIVYKPALSSLSFLEVQHGHQVCMRMTA